jgi:hypothetical protein
MSSTILLPPRAQLCIRYSSNKHTQFQRPISFRLGQVTDQVVLHLCAQRSRRARAVCRTWASVAHAGAGNRHAQGSRRIDRCEHGLRVCGELPTMRRCPGGSLAENMGCPGCRGSERTLAACRSVGAGTRYEVACIQGESPRAGVPEGCALLLT